MYERLNFTWYLGVKGVTESPQEVSLKGCKRDKKKLTTALLGWKPEEQKVKKKTLKKERRARKKAGNLRGKCLLFGIQTGISEKGIYVYVIGKMLEFLFGGRNFLLENYLYSNRGWKVEEKGAGESLWYFTGSRVHFSIRYVISGDIGLQGEAH